MPSYKYPLLNDATWLRQKYLVENYSTIDLAREAGAKTANSARQALMRNGIAVRDYYDGLTYGREEDGFSLDESNIPAFEGCLLGDGGLVADNPETSVPHFKKKNKFYDHILLIRRLLFPSGKDSIIKEEQNSCRGKCFTYFRIRSLSHKVLLPHYQAWYPESNGYVKCIPTGLELTSETILHWFLDDGSTTLRKRKTKQLEIVFCSESFSKEDQQRLCDQMKKKFGIAARLRPVEWGTGNRIKIPQSQAADFFALIGPPPVPSLAYKWK